MTRSRVISHPPTLCTFRDHPQNVYSALRLPGVTRSRRIPGEPSSVRPGARFRAVVVTPCDEALAHPDVPIWS
jgi:hypothetical protein